MPKRLNDDQIRRNLRQAEIRKADAGYAKRVNVIKSRKQTPETADDVSLAGLLYDPSMEGQSTTTAVLEWSKAMFGGVGVSVASNTPNTYTNGGATTDPWESMKSSNFIEDDYLGIEWPIVVMNKARQAAKIVREKEVKEYLASETPLAFMKRDLALAQQEFYDKKASEERKQDSVEIIKNLLARADNPAEKLETEPRTALTEIGRDSFGYNSSYSLRWVDPKIERGCPEGANFSFSGVIYSLAKSTLLRMLADASDAGIAIGNIMVRYPFPQIAGNIANITINGEVPMYFIERWVVDYAKGGLSDLYSENYMQPAIQKPNINKETAKVVAGQRAITLEEEV